MNKLYLILFCALFVGTLDFEIASSYAEEHGRQGLGRSAPEAGDAQAGTNGKESHIAERDQPSTNAAGQDNKAGTVRAVLNAPSSGSLPNTSGPVPAATKHRRLVCKGQDCRAIINSERFEPMKLSECDKRPNAKATFNACSYAKDGKHICSTACYYQQEAK